MKKKETVKLLPCPFCGKKPRTYFSIQDYKVAYIIECKRGCANKHVWLYGGDICEQDPHDLISFENIMTKTISAWNNRGR